LARRSSPPSGLDRDWNSLLEICYAEAQKPWGGVTIDSHTGARVQSDADRYAISVKTPCQESVTVPEAASRELLAQALADARIRFVVQLARADHHLGVFHDNDLRRIDIDPVLVVESLQQVETVGAYTRAVGGAYHFASRNGYFPPHVG